MHSRDEHLSQSSGQTRGRPAGSRPAVRSDGPQALLRTLQNDAGNEAVARTIASGASERQFAGSALPLQRAATPTVQRAPQVLNTPVGQTEGFGGGLSDDDVRLLGETAVRVKELMAQAQDAGKQVLLFIGVGTGNPQAAWGNPTGSKAGGITDADQQSPGFLAQAEQQSYQVISVNFNVGDGAAVSETGSSGSVARLSVPAKFPLDADGKKKAERAVAALHEAAGKADRFAIMNAVTQADYQPLIDLANAKRNGQSAYLKSYMADGKTSAFSPMTKKKGMQSEGGNFSSMGEVFGADMTME
ncbi:MULTISPECIES: hypothetical protein [unclassified Streptomyces]|uniref:hypothetical protein n=1 Tax=unclassified Streptomyces TaxID=2593676 RepID=UPI0035D7CCC2